MRKIKSINILISNHINYVFRIHCHRYLYTWFRCL
ncbi:MAG: hypothetical protein LBU92_03975 [Prevotellaceae bacterium]|nr:hypothetical protein [Prevotellaceae bacterium]